MTREEEITRQAKEHARYAVDGDRSEISFQLGAVWADQHPIDKKINEMLLAYTKWLDKRGFFKEDLQCDFLHQIETFLEMKGEEK